MMNLPAFSSLSDRDLLSALQRLSGDERRATAALIAALAELDARRLYLGEGYSSLFTYCTQVLHLSEHAAYGRIEAARAARRFPVILDRLAEGDLTLTSLGLLAPHFTLDNHRALLDAARRKSKRDVEHLIASIRPLPAVPSSVRKLPPSIPASGASLLAEGPLASLATNPPTPSPITAPRPQAAPAVVSALAPERYKVQFTLSAATLEKLRRAQDLMRHRVPDGDIAAIFERALTLLLEHLEKTKLAAADHPRACRAGVSKSRAIPAAVRREVWARDQGQCAFVGTRGRCTERGFLEFHHLRPYAAGGAAVIENIQLRCRAHNQHEADQYFLGRQSSNVRDGPPL
jgi:hypothetical protein